MNPTIIDILETLENLAPIALAEKWDNVGLLVGNPQSSVATILIGLDPTNSLVDEAIEIGADTIITHHPVIFKPLAAINTSDPAGRLLQKALSHNINIIGCHTNLDSAIDGVNDILGEGLGLKELLPLVPALQGEDSSSGLGRIGNYPKPVTEREFLTRLFALLKLDTVSIAGRLPTKIEKVAVCGGSGSDFAPEAYRQGADVYVSAEIKHAMAIWAREVGFAVIDATHYATEKPVTAYLKNKLNEIAAGNSWQIDIRLTETEEPPFVSVNTFQSDYFKP